MTPQGRHFKGYSGDSGGEVSPEFARRFKGSYKHLKGKFLCPGILSPAQPDFRIRQAKLLWAKIQSGAIRGASAEAVRRDYAKEFKELKFT